MQTKQCPKESENREQKHKIKWNWGNYWTATKKKSVERHGIVNENVLCSYILQISPSSLYTLWHASQFNIFTFISFFILFAKYIFFGICMYWTHFNMLCVYIAGLKCYEIDAEIAH